VGAPCIFRPAAIQPLHGITPKIRWYRLLHTADPPVPRCVAGALSDICHDDGQLGRAMIFIAAKGARTPAVENGDGNAVGKTAAGEWS
jgi:hypothetical protein